MSVQATQEDLPERVGHYDVLFRLETGADASILVARGAEPGAAPVTIKRIAPVITQGKDIDAFLARTEPALALFHPNVVAIRHLLCEGEAICVVTEYLDGEMVATLLRRLEVENKSIGFGLATHVVAEAAAGIGAGHAAGMLHERLTPSDVFIGHEGRVKVFDVGVARAFAEVTGASITAAELPYASPERCKGDDLDARSDVYSLGVVLWELMTGVSPFEREGQAATLRAIMAEDPRLPPSHVLRNLPSGLSDIALRAIDRVPANRYPTAAALRDALLAFGREVPMGGADPSAALAILMQNLFAKRIRNNARLLRRADSNRNVAATSSPSIPDDPPPSVDDPGALDRPTLDAFRPLPLPPAALPSPPPPPPPRTPPPPPRVAAPAPEPPAPESPAPEPSFAPEPVEAPIELPGVSTNRWRVPAIAAAIMVVLGVGWLIFGRSSGPPSETTVASSDPPRPVRSSEIPAPPSHPPAPAPTPSPPAPAAASAVETTLRIETVPPGATIVVDGASVGVSPKDVKLPRSDKPVVLELRHAGYEPLRESIVPDVDQKMRLSLEATRAATTAPKPKPTSTASANPYRRFD